MAETLGKDDRQRLMDMYEKYSRHMYARAKSILGDGFEAEDAVQNAFVSVSKKIRLTDGKDEDELCGYMLTVVKNEAYMILRKKKNEDLPGELPDVSDGADTEIEISRREEYEYAIKIISEMDEIYRGPLYLNVVMGYSAKETAALLKRRAATVRVQISRAKQMIAKKLKEAGYES